MNIPTAYSESKIESGSTLQLAFFGDIVGRAGRSLLCRQVATLRQKYALDLVIANVENAAGGMGISLATAQELLHAGVNAMTLGDHAWQQRDAEAVLNNPEIPITRPANYPGNAPGRGWIIISSPQVGKIGVFNLLGRVFTGALVDCPFRTADQLLSGPLSDCVVRICDFHAEATSEKAAMARYLDGRVSLLVGTHTHVQTADETILPAGSGFITDLGMSGSTNGIIGMQTQTALDRFLTGRPSTYKLAEGAAVLCGIWCSIDRLTGRTLEIRRLRVAA